MQQTSFHSVNALWTLCSGLSRNRLARVIYQQKSRNIYSRFDWEFIFLSISELHFNVFGVLETKYLFHICVVALRSFFYWDTQQPASVEERVSCEWKISTVEMYRIWFRFVRYCFPFPPSARDETSIAARLDRNLFMILYDFMLPLSPLPLSTRKTTRANKNSTFTQSAIIYSESTRSEKQLHTRRSR